MAVTTAISPKPAEAASLNERLRQERASLEARATDIRADMQLATERLMDVELAINAIDAALAAMDHVFGVKEVAPAAEPDPYTGQPKPFSEASRGTELERQMARAKLTDYQRGYVDRQDVPSTHT